MACAIGFRGYYTYICSVCAVACELGIVVVVMVMDFCELHVSENVRRRDSDPRFQVGGVWEDRHCRSLILICGDLYMQW